MKSAKYWIEKLNLQPHPEGGWFSEIYRSIEIIKEDGLPERYTGNRNFGTSIYFLLESGQPSKFHRLKSDEIWHFYQGSPVNIVILNNDGYSIKILGADHDAGERFQVVIPSCTWFAAYVDEKDAYSLIGCTMAPGFVFEDFEMGVRNDLAEQFPDLEDLIVRLT